MLLLERTVRHRLGRKERPRGFVVGSVRRDGDSLALRIAKRRVVITKDTACIDVGSKLPFNLALGRFDLWSVTRAEMRVFWTRTVLASARSPSHLRTRVPDAREPGAAAFTKCGR